MVAVRVPFSDHIDAVAELHDPHAIGGLCIFDLNLAAGRGITLWERETHQRLARRKGSQPEVA